MRCEVLSGFEAHAYLTTRVGHPFIRWGLQIAVMRGCGLCATCNSMCATLLQGHMARQNWRPCADPVPQAAAFMDAPLHILVKLHQQGCLLRQGMRSKRSLPGPASQDADHIHWVKA